MPIYDFQCPTCKYKAEHLLRLSDSRMIFCPMCKIQMDKLVSAPHFKFEGGLNSGVDNHSSFKTRHDSCRLPINIIDQMPDGTCKVSSTAKDPEIIND